METLSTLSTVDSLSGSVISLVSKVVNEVNRARSDVATLPDEVENLQTQCEKLSDRVTRVQEANAKLQEVHVTNPNLGEVQNREGGLEKLLKRLEESLESDLLRLESLKKDDEEPKSKKVRLALIRKGAANLQKQIQEILRRIEDDCRDLDEAIAVRIFEGGVRTEAGIGRVEIRVGDVATGVDQGFRDVKELLSERVPIIPDLQASVDQGFRDVTELLTERVPFIPDLQSSVDQGFRDVKKLLTERVPIIPDLQSSGITAQVLPEYPVAMEERASLLVKTVISLKDGNVVGIYGMGGIGKTTLAKQVFNNISGKFVYTCFVNDVKSIQPRKLDEEILKKFQKVGGTSSLRSWADLIHEKTLIIMDDIDRHDQLASVLSRRREFGKGSVVMFTTRNSHLCKRPYIVPFEVPFLEVGDAKKLLCKHAFNEEDIPERLQSEMSTYVEEVVKKCDGLPLSLEVIGSYLYSEDAKTWEGTILKLSRAQGVDGAEEDSLFATLKVSYDALAKEEKQMFLDIATFFVQEPLDFALAAMSTSYTDPRTCWGNLVKRCLVKEKMDWVDHVAGAVLNCRLKSVDEYGYPEFETQHVWMHEHLQDLGKRLAGNSFLSGRGEEAANEIVEKINSYKGPGEIQHLRSVSCSYPYPLGDEMVSRTVLQMSSLAKVSGLKYLRLSYCRHHQDQSQELPRDLEVLQWESLDGYDFSNTLHDMKNLTVLELHDANWQPKRFVQLPDSLAGWTKLKILVLKCTDLYAMELPESFGELLSLEVLILENVDVTHLPECFGNLSSIKTLVFNGCRKLTQLPESFGNLSSIKTLVFFSCKKLTHLPDSFGNLSSLRILTIHCCSELTRLPPSFSNLSGLCILSCPDTELVEFEDAFQNLSMFQNLEVLLLHLLNANVPPSFSQLSGSKTLQFVKLILRQEDSDNVCWDLSPLEGLTLQGKELTALSQEFGRRVSGDKVDLRFELDKGSAGSSQRILAMTAIVISRRNGVPSLSQGPGLLGLPQVQTFPKSFGKLPSTGERIEKLKMCEDGLIEEVDSIAGLSSFNLRVLQVSFSSQLKTPPKSVGQFGSLDVLKISGCSKSKTLPESLGQLGSLRVLIISSCSKLETLPESLGQLGSLLTLFISDCPMLKTLPDSLGQLGSFAKLTISGCSKLKTLPESLGQLGSLGSLHISDCPKLKTLPESLGQIGAVWNLNISDCPQLKTLPESLGQIGSLGNLHISDCPKLKTLPESLGQIGAVWNLNISDCPQLKTLPESLGQIGSLGNLNISDCPKLKTLPQSLEQLGSLKTLTITNCGELLTLPESLEQLGSLKTLKITNCGELLTLPESMGNLASLDYVSIRRCSKLKAVPQNWGKVTSSPSQASGSSCSLLRRPSLDLEVYDCPSLMDFVRNLEWDSIREISPACHCFCREEEEVRRQTKIRSLLLE